MFFRNMINKLLLLLYHVVTSESGWDKLFSADSDGSVSTRLLNCPDVKLKLSTMILLSNGFCSSPMLVSMIILGESPLGSQMTWCNVCCHDNPCHMHSIHSFSNNNNGEL